jgi:hypothetical protein
MRILVMTHLMVMSPPFAKPVLVLSFDFGLTGSDLSLVEIWKMTDSPIPYLKCVLLIKQGRDQVHGLYWWENTNRTKTFCYSSLYLGTLNKTKVMLFALFNYNIGGKTEG